MKNHLVPLLTATLILVSCQNSNEQRKQEINLEMNRLNLQMNKRIDERDELKERVNKLYSMYDSKQRDASEAERRTYEEALVRDLTAIEAEEHELKIRNLKDEMQLRRLELEYAKLLND